MLRAALLQFAQGDGGQKGGGGMPGEGGEEESSSALN